MAENGTGTRRVTHAVAPGGFFGVVATVLALSTAGCTSILGDFDFVGGTPDASMGTTPDGSRGATLGIACTGDAQCSPGETCADGVCCESACDGVCESCNQAGALGRCNPIPAMTDPGMECVMIPLPDAGAAPPVGAGPDASADAASDAAAANDGAAASDGGVAATNFNVPDAGIESVTTPCAGTCNGARACTYPDAKTSCGTQFCNTSTQLGGFACDGTGRCGPELVDCNDYVCQSVTDAGAVAVGACATSCTDSSSCGPKAFCDGQACVPKDGNGHTCTNGDECASGWCVTNGPSSVCCNQQCGSEVPGGTCSANGSVGACTCPSCTGAGNSCVIEYIDRDGDGHGDRFATPGGSPATEQVGCSNDPPAAHSGWSLTNDDCDDDDANVYPGQTQTFTHPSAGNGTYDYNCDGALEKGTAEFIGASCGVCGAGTTSCTNTFACTSSTLSAESLSCGTTTFACEGIYYFPPVPLASEEVTQAAGIATTGPTATATFVPPPVYSGPCCAGAQSGFTSFSGVATGPNSTCGLSGVLTTCGACDYGTVSGASAPTSVQSCR